MEAILAAVMHHHRAHQHGEEDGGDHRLLLPGQGEGTRKGSQPVGQGGAFLPLAHSERSF